MIMVSSLRAALVLSVSAAVVPVVRGSFSSMQGEEGEGHVEAEKASSELQTKLADEIQNAEAALQVDESTTFGWSSMDFPLAEVDFPLAGVHNMAGLEHIQYMKLTDVREALKQDIASAEDRLKSAIRDGTNATIQKIQDDIAKATQVMDALNTKIAGVDGKVVTLGQDMRDNFGQVKNNMDSMGNKIVDLKNDVSQVNTNMDKMEKNINQNIDNKIGSMGVKMDSQFLDTKTEVKEGFLKIGTLENKIGTLENKIDAQGNKMDAQTAQSSKIESKIDALLAARP